MIKSIKGKTTLDIYNGVNSKASRKLPSELIQKARRLLDLLSAAHYLGDLNIPPGNRLELLKGDLSGFYSVRINSQWRIIFRWFNGEADDVEIIDYH